MIENQIKKRKSDSRNGLRQALSQKAQTQQLGNMLEQVNAAMHKVRPISGSKRRINHNGFMIHKGNT